MISSSFLNCKCFQKNIWTLQYFFSRIKLVMGMDNCIFCKIIKGEIPSYKVYEDDTVMAFLDVNPYSPGHTLIVPKEHTLDIDSISREVLMHVFDTAKDISTLLTEKLGCEGFTLIQNNGFVQEVKHFHLHVIPKYKNKFDMDIKEAHEKITH